MNAHIVELLVADVEQRANHAVDEGLAADEAMVWAQPGLKRQMLTRAKTDFEFERTVIAKQRLRVERGLTLDQLADLSGVSRAMISRIERSEASPTAALLARLCSALGVSLSVFFASTEGEPRRCAKPPRLCYHPRSMTSLGA